MFIEVFRNSSNIPSGNFIAKIFNDFLLLAIFVKCLKNISKYASSTIAIICNLEHIFPV